jgi:hypothetical protein
LIEFTQYSRANLPPAQHTVVRIREMLAEGHLVWDRRGSMRRPMRPEDIAILCPTHARAKVYATALSQARLRPRLTAQGWQDSGAVRLARVALAWVADPADFHAAIAPVVTELAATRWSPPRFRWLMARPWTSLFCGHCVRSPMEPPTGTRSRRFSWLACISEWHERHTAVPAPWRNIGRNARYPSGSGRKFKKCCVGKPSGAVARPV